MIDAVLTFGNVEVNENVTRVVARYGSPERQVFGSAGFWVAVVRGAGGSIHQLRISSEESLLAPTDYPRPIARDQAETLLEDVLPGSVRKGEPKSSILFIGALTRRVLLYPDLSITRDYINNDLVALTVIWR